MIYYYLFVICFIAIIDKHQYYNGYHQLVNADLGSGSGQTRLIQGKNKLNYWIEHYEPLNYDSQSIHARAKRSLSPELSAAQNSPSELRTDSSSTKADNSHPSESPFDGRPSSTKTSHFTFDHTTNEQDKLRRSFVPIRIEFDSHGHRFILHLKPDPYSVFAKDVIIEGPDGQPFDHHGDELDLNRVLMVHDHDYKYSSHEHDANNYLHYQNDDERLRYETVTATDSSNILARVNNETHQKNDNLDQGRSNKKTHHFFSKPKSSSLSSSSLVNQSTSSKSQPIVLEIDHVHGSLKDGVFEGRIFAKDGRVFYVERSSKYMDDLRKYNESYRHIQNSDQLGFHSVIYESSDVKHNEHNNPDATAIKTNHAINNEHNEIGAGCANDDAHVREWMSKVQNAPSEAIYDLKKVQTKSSNHGRSKRSPNHGPDNMHSWHYNLRDLMDESIEKWRDAVDRSGMSFNEQDEDDFIDLIQRSRRRKRWTEPDRKDHTWSPLDSSNTWDFGRNQQPRVSHKEMYPPPIETDYNGANDIYTIKKRACSMYIQTDTYLWEHIKRYEPSDIKAREEIASLVASHIKAVNHIYENTDFNGIRGLKFIVQRLKINDSSACDTHEKRETNPFCAPDIDVSNFLNLNSQLNHNDFCLAYIFTYRDFAGGTLGLAWVASPSGASGGICETYKSYTENIGGLPAQTKRSLNTGIITFVNYNTRVPPKVSELTLAHEIGHNFGSPHDYPLDCRPGGAAGNYIMYSSATSGERDNNNKFSPCSVRNISAVLHAVMSNEGKENCFQEDDGPFCGNKIVEEGEECDCGYDSTECSEKCCYPREIEPYLASEPWAKPCTRRLGATCSPSEGPCCKESCELEAPRKMCHAQTECSYESFCTGYTASCPPPHPKPNKTECKGGTKVCWRGHCVGSICQKYQLEECFLTARAGAKPDEMCEVSCQEPHRPSTCRPTSMIESMKNISGLKLRPGSPCNDFQGYCDSQQICRAVDNDGPFVKLKNLLFNHRTFLSIKEWVTAYWLPCVSLICAVLFLIIAFLRCRAISNLKSSMASGPMMAAGSGHDGLNKKRSTASRLTETFRNPAETFKMKKSRPTRPVTCCASRHTQTSFTSGVSSDDAAINSSGHTSSTMMMTRSLSATPTILDDASNGQSNQHQPSSSTNVSSAYQTSQSKPNTPKDSHAGHGSVLSASQHAGSRSYSHYQNPSQYQYHQHQSHHQAHYPHPSLIGSHSGHYGYAGAVGNGGSGVGARDGALVAGSNQASHASQLIVALPSPSPGSGPPRSISTSHHHSHGLAALDRTPPPPYQAIYQNALISRHPTVPNVIPSAMPTAVPHHNQPHVSIPPLLAAGHHHHLDHPAIHYSVGHSHTYASTPHLTDSGHYGSTYGGLAASRLPPTGLSHGQGGLGGHIGHLKSSSSHLIDPIYHRGSAYWNASNQHQLIYGYTGASRMDKESNSLAAAAAASSNPNPSSQRLSSLAHNQSHSQLLQYDQQQDDLGLDNSHRT